jgi:hypothetical protein
MFGNPTVLTPLCILCGTDNCVPGGEQGGEGRPIPNAGLLLTPLYLRT